MDQGRSLLRNGEGRHVQAMELWEDQARSVPKRQAWLEDSRKAPEPGKLSSSMEEEEEQQKEEEKQAEDEDKESEEEEEKQEHHWLEETQEPASISFSYPGGTGNAGESANNSKDPGASNGVNPWLSLKSPANTED